MTWEAFDQMLADIRRSGEAERERNDRIAKTWVLAALAERDVERATVKRLAGQLVAERTLHQQTAAERDKARRQRDDWMAAKRHAATADAERLQGELNGVLAAADAADRWAREVAAEHGLPGDDTGERLGAIWNLLKSTVEQRDQAQELNEKAMRWHGHSVTLNSVAYRISQALAETKGADEYPGNPIADVERLIAGRDEALAVVAVMRDTLNELAGSDDPRPVSPPRGIIGRGELTDDGLQPCVCVPDACLELAEDDPVHELVECRRRAAAA